MSTAVILETLPAPADAATGLGRRRVYIFLTRQGFLFSLLLIVMLAGAVNYVNSMAYLMTFLLAGLFLVCMLHTYRNLRGLVITCNDAEPVFTGDDARFPLLIDNRSGAERPALFVRPAGGRGTPLAAGARGALLALCAAANEPARVHLVIRTARRGALRIPRFIIETRFPLGLFRAWSYLDGATGTVYPRPGGSHALPPAMEQQVEREGGRRPGADDFTGFAGYRPGDSIRRIDWRALAREQGLLVKRFSGSGGKKLVLSWSLLAESMPLEARLSQLCRWVLEAERMEFEYALELPGTVIPSANGSKHRHRCLEALAGFGGPVEGEAQ